MGAFALRLGLPIPKLYSRSELFYILLSLAIKVTLILGFGLFRQSWRSIGVRDLTRLGKAVAAFTLLSSTAAFLLSPYYRIPRSIPLIDGMLLLLSWGAARLLVRLFLEGNVRRKGRGQNKRVLVIGAGDAGTMIVREMLRHPESCLTPVGFLDDDPGKWNTTFVGYPVFGPVKRLAAVARGQSVDEILIAIPSVMGDRHPVHPRNGPEGRNTCADHPGIWEVLSGKVSISSIRDVEVEDSSTATPSGWTWTRLPGTSPAVWSSSPARADPSAARLSDRSSPSIPGTSSSWGGENSLFQIEQELRNIHHVRNITTVVADVRTGNA